MTIQTKTQTQTQQQQQRPAPTGFEVYDLAISAILALRPLLPSLRRHSRELTKQLEKAAASVALNLNEGNSRLGKDRPYHFSVAAGSAREVRAALDVAEAFGWLQPSDTAPVRPLIESVLRITYRLTHPR